VYSPKRAHLGRWPITRAACSLIVGASANHADSQANHGHTHKHSAPPSDAGVARVIPSHELPTACAPAHRMHRVLLTFLLCAWQCWRGLFHPVQGLGRGALPPSVSVQELQGSTCHQSHRGLRACPVCPSSPMKQYFWSYNMPTHWRRAHSQQPMPPALCQEIEVSTEELARLETLKQPKLSSESGRSASTAREGRGRQACAPGRAGGGATSWPWAPSSSGMHCWPGAVRCSAAVQTVLQLSLCAYESPCENIRMRKNAVAECADFPAARPVRWFSTLH